MMDAALAEAVLNSLPLCLAVLDQAGQIVAANEAWLAFARQARDELGRAGVGANYLEAWRRATTPGEALRQQVAAGLEAVLAGAQPAYSVEYPGPADDWYFMRVVPFAGPTSGLMMVGIYDISRRRRAEEKLRESEAEFRRTFDQAPIGAALLDLEGRCLRVNEALARMWGYSEQELRGKSYTELAHPEDVARGRPEVRRLIRGEIDQYASDERYSCKDGQVVWGHVSLRLVRNATGAPLYLMPMIEDITGCVRAEETQRQAEAALQESEKNYRAIVEHTSDMLMVADEQGRIVEWNLATERSTGLRRAEVLGQPIWEVQERMVMPEQRSPERLKRFQTMLLEALRTGVSPVFERPVEVEVLRPDGQRCHLQQMAFPVPTEKGYRLGVFMRDITGRVQAETALRASEERYRGLAESLPDMIFILDREGRIEYVNMVAARSLGQTPAELIGKRQADFFPPATAQHHLQSVQSVFATGETRATNSELPLPGGALWIDNTLTPLRNAEGEIVAVLGVSRDVTERVQAVTALRASEERYRRLAESLPDMVFILDREGCLEYVNMVAARLLGRTPAELIGTRQADFFPPATAQQHMQSVQRVFATGEAYAGSSHLPLPGGALWIDNILTPLRNAEGEVVSVLGVSRDITERYHAETALRESQARLQLALESGQADSWELNLANGEAVYIQNGMSLLGYALGELPPTEETGVSLIHPDDLATARAALKAYMEGKTPVFETECRLRTKSGGWLWAVSRGRAIAWDEAGRPTRLLGVNVDITARKAAEAALRESEERFRNYIENSPDGIWVADASGRLHDVNPAACELVGYTCEEMLGRTVFDLVPVDEVTATQARYGELQAGGVFFGEMLLKRKDGGTVPVIRNAVKLPNGDAIYFCTDITARKQAEEEIRRLNTGLERQVAERTAELRLANDDLIRAMHVKDEFLATVSHELRTPLTGILGLTGVFQLGVYGSLTDRQRQALQSIQASGQHLLDLIGDVLDYAWAEASQLSIEKTPVEVYQVCQAVLRFVRLPAQQKKLRLIFNQDTAVSVVQADERRLKQMLIRLLTNAIKFTPESGSIGLEVTGDQIASDQAAGGTPAPREAQFTVWDTGIGIAPADQARIFEPFVQLDGGLARKYEGLGLGLALVRRLAEQHGGRLTVESEGAPGQGSRFTLSLPWSPSS